MSSSNQPTDKPTPTKHRLQVVAKRPCRLERGELRRVSQDRRQRLIAYHLGCPRCGFVNAVFHLQQGQRITESEDGEHVSFSEPIRCVFCKVTLHVTQSVAELEEGPDVRPMPSR